MASRTRLPSKISGQVVKVSGEHVYVESGVHVVVPDVSVSGSIVQISGQHIFVESGVHVVAESGLHVQISGQHVFVESGVQVVATVNVSGQPVKISGEHVYVESGVYTASGVGVQIQSGQGVVTQSGVYVASGIYQASGVGVTVQSGIGVLISGQHVFVESGVYTIGGFTSGAYFASGIYVGISGQHVYAESGTFVGAAIFAGGVGPAEVYDVGGGEYTLKVFLAGMDLISGLLYFASGIGVQIQSGAGVLISGQHVFVESGVYLASGIYVVAAAASGTYAASGVGVIINSGVGVTVQSGYGVVLASGLGVLISGQHVFVESGIFLASGTHILLYDSIGGPAKLKDEGGGDFSQLVTPYDLTEWSGLGVLISGQHVFVESGVYLASGIYVVAAAASGTYAASGVGVIINSGVGVTVQSGIILLSGWFPAIMLSGLQLASGGSILVSGQGVIVGTATLSGLRLISGQSVTIDPATLSGLRLISGQSVTIASGTYVNWVQTSGTVAIQSGEIHVMSGAVTIYLLSSEPIINNSGNPIVVGAISHGIPLWSADVISVTVKALSINSGDIYMGGFKAGQGPFSGQGFLMEPGEAINMDVDNIGKVHLFAEVSGDRASYIAVTG